MERKRNYYGAANVTSRMKMRNLQLAFSTRDNMFLPHLTVGALSFLLLLPLEKANAQLSDQANALVQTPTANFVNESPLDSANAPFNFDSRRQIEDMHREIERLETEQGPWGTGLAEQLQGLGKTYQLRGEHEEAIDAFERAIHVNRINQGLYDLSQVGIVEDMLDSLLVTGRWDDVHDRQQHLYWLYKRNYGDKDPRILPMIDKLGSWYVNDYALNPKSRNINNVVDAYNLFGQASIIIEEEFGPSDLRLIMPLRGLVLSNWFLWSYASRHQTRVVNTDQLTELGTRPNSFSSAQNQIVPYLRNNYANGKAALNKMIEIYSTNPDAPVGAAETAKIELADWHMLSRRWRSATELYIEAYNSLHSDEETKAQADKLFERPVALPDLVLLESDVEGYNQRSLSAGPATSYVLVKYDVNRFGEARNIDIIESQPENNVGIRARVKRSISDTRFRPRIVDGEAVDSEGLVQKYVFSE